MSCYYQQINLLNLSIRRLNNMETKTYKKRKFSIDKILGVINIIALCLIGFTMIYPFWEILVKSFMTDKEIISSSSSTPEISLFSPTTSVLNTHLTSSIDLHTS